MPPHDAQMRSPVCSSAISQVLSELFRMWGCSTSASGRSPVLHSSQRRPLFTRQSGGLLDELDFGPFDSSILERKSEPITAQPLPQQRQQLFPLGLDGYSGESKPEKRLNPLLRLQLRDHPRTPFRRGWQAVVTNQRRPDEGLVVTDQEQFPVGGRVRQFLRATHQMPQRPFPAGNHDGASEAQRLLAQRDDTLFTVRIDHGK